MLTKLKPTKLPKLPLNVNLMRKVVKHLKRVPARLYMGTWICHAKPGKKVELGMSWDGPFGKKLTSWGEPIIKVIPECGTVGCFAGWVAQLSSKHELHPDRAEVYARRKLKLFASGFHSNQLFMVSNWSQPFQDQYIKAKTDKRRVKILGDYVEHVIKEAQRNWAYRHGGQN